MKKKKNLTGEKAVNAYSTLSGKPRKKNNMNELVQQAIKVALGEIGPPPLICRDLRLKGNQYFHSPQVKTSIVLHHTAGTTAKSAIDWWNQTPEQVGTAYVVDKDGKIYEVFPPDNWGYHIGSKITQYFDKASIGIEIVSRGGIFKENDKYVWYPAYPNKKQKVIVNPLEVYATPTEWREFSYFDQYTDAQVVSVTWLVAKLVKDFNIDVKGFTGDFYQYNEEVSTKKLPGIWSHTTFRKDKMDIFPQENLIQAIEETLKELGLA